MKMLALVAFIGSFISSVPAHADASIQGCLNSNDHAAGCTTIPQALPAPEMSPDIAFAAVTLITGAALIIRARQE